MKATLIGIALLFAATSYSQQNISTDSAMKHVGEVVTVCSTVEQVKVTNKMTILRLWEKGHKYSLSVIVLSKNLKNFEGSLKKWNDVLVCVTGKISLQKNKPQMIISKQSQLVQDAPIEAPM